MHKIVTLIILIATFVLGFWYFGGTSQKELSADLKGAVLMSEGNYEIKTDQSTFEWAGKKPLIDGYINSGTIDITEGSATISKETITEGSFVLDINTLHVGLTAAKPGREGALEGHLKGAGFFDVANYPTAEFIITKVENLTDEFSYTVTGDLTLKGVTHEISFPAYIYEKDGMLMAEAHTEIDRTKWGITAGSGNFFEDLGDNVIDDMVAISFSLMAEKVK